MAAFARISVITEIGQVLGEPARLTPLDRLEEVARRVFAAGEDVVSESSE